MEIPLGMATSLLSPEILHAPDSISDSKPVPWEASYLNPKNRIDVYPSLHTGHIPWHFLGADLLRSRLMIIPKFALRRQPMRVDVYLAGEADLGSPICKGLDADASVLGYDRTKLRRLPLVQHIMCALEHWSSSPIRGDFGKTYMSLPFSSRILIESIRPDPRDMSIHMVPDYNLEFLWLSVAELQEGWKLPLGDDR
jgi:hypothetical protein